MHGGWHSARLRRRLGFAVCGASLAGLAGSLRFWWDDTATAGVLVSAIGAFVSVAALVTDLVQNGTGTAGPSDGEIRRRAADSLADAVREQWGAEARLRRLQDPAPLDVEWEPAERRLADHAQNIRWRPPLPAPRDSDDGAVLGALPALPSRRLVVLGGPGTGKSVLAIRFVIGRLAERQPGEPVPVIFPLVGWDPRRTGLRDWMATRLATDYPPLAAPVDDRRLLARALLDSDLVLPVLDGFDELARPAQGEAVRRVNAELEADLPLLLTSRHEAWETAVTEGDVLTAAEVVELRPLRLDRAAAHLERTARPLRLDDGEVGTVWTPVLNRLTRSPASPAARALSTPLMVALARAVYSDTSRDPSELLDPDRFSSVESVEEHLLKAFVPAAFADVGPRAAETAVRRLTVLARAARRRAGGRLAWWELESMLPRTLALYAPGLLAIVALSALVLPVAVARTASDLAGAEDLTSIVAALAGQTIGFAFGARFLLPSAPGRRGRRLLVRQGLVTAGASVLLWAGFAWTDDLRLGFRFGGVSDGWIPDLFGGCLFATLFTLFFGIAGLPRRPVPLSLPWSGSAGRASARVCGAALLLSGACATGLVLAGRSGSLWTALVGITCAVAGVALLAGATRRAGRDSPHPVRAGRVARRFVVGITRGTAAALVIGVGACAAAGLTAVAVTAAKSASATDLAGRQFGGWRFVERHGVRTAVTARPLRGTLLIPGGGARPVAYPEGAKPSDCTLPLLDRRKCVPFTSLRTVFESRDGAVAVRLTFAGERTTVAYAANLRSTLPQSARGWLAQGPVSGLLQRTLPPLLGAGVLIGVVGGCVCGVYRALSVPSDVMRAAGPASSLRTDRTASVTRGGAVALLVGLVCVPLAALPGDPGGLVHVGTQLWLPLGTAALSLSAWGRFTVTRVWLAMTGRLPWRLMAFLEDAHRRGVLRQNGASFEFRHVRLHAHLAGDSPSEDTPLPARADAARPLQPYGGRAADRENTGIGGSGADRG
ncbi:NACHT domain-containing protein [Streptomyces sp. S3(2020)]|uniref:NACHT domain-containing protein n=1 Tax=Streptomyces sp. S3(2020) TaxID=2732044 RepID=UPI001487B19C|nr:NACHT domain-containing protein [Streptomyces sp. S3(2020)]NNN34346.1 NACHT domain-containing protein [Streptomyces sp. S3(2020)]